MRTIIIDELRTGMTIIRDSEELLILDRVAVGNTINLLVRQQNGRTNRHTYVRGELVYTTDDAQPLPSTAEQFRDGLITARLDLFAEHATKVSDQFKRGLMLPREFLDEMRDIVASCDESLLFLNPITA